MIDYNQLEELSARIVRQVVELVRTMTPDKTEEYTVKDFFSAANAAGGYIKSINCNIGDEFLKMHINKALEKVCKAKFCLDMLNQMAVVDISCYEKVRTSYDELIDCLSLALTELNSTK